MVRASIPAEASGAASPSDVPRYRPLGRGSLGPTGEGKPCAEEGGAQRALMRAPAVARNYAAAPVAQYEVTDLELGREGSLAWILNIDEPRFPTLLPPRPDRLEVHIAVGAPRSETVLSQDVVLDSSPAIDPKSLTLNGKTLSWVKAGQPQSTVIP